MNNKNLVPFQFQSGSQARENGKKGGIASGKVRSDRKKFEEKIDVLFRVMTRVKVKEIQKMIDFENLPDDQKEMASAALEIVKEGGAEMMLVMETLTSKKASFANKMMTLFDLFEHRYGKARQFDELTFKDGVLLERPIIHIHPVRSLEKKSRS